MDERRKKEIKPLVALVASLPFGVVGLLLFFITIIPPAEQERSTELYVAGLLASAFFILLFGLMYTWAERQLQGQNEQ